MNATSSSMLHPQHTQHKERSAALCVSCCYSDLNEISTNSQILVIFPSLSRSFCAVLRLASCVLRLASCVLRCAGLVVWIRWMELVYVHHHPSLIPSVVELLNKQWQRSEQTRTASLEKSTEGLPLHMALIQPNEEQLSPSEHHTGTTTSQTTTNQTATDHPTTNQTTDQTTPLEPPIPTLIGCSSLAKVVDPTIDNGVLIENVLVDPNRRAKGYGRILMEKTEAVAIKLGYTMAYLSTTDKELFYAHLGYEPCDPVTTGSGAETLLSADRMSGIMHLFGSSAKNIKGPKIVWMKKKL